MSTCYNKIMTLIRSVQVIDGSGKPPYKADVLLSGDHISAIGTYPNKKANTIINGLGYYLTPGFIDVNTDSDHYLSLFTNPSQEDFLIQGVTTTIGGMCGASLAPLLYGSLESIQKWSDINQINVDWHTTADFFKTFGRIKLGVNFGTLAGHATIRRAILGEQSRDLTENEMNVFEHTLERAMKEGALGLSTGLGYVHSQGVPYAEIKRLAKIVARYGGVYATHLRNEKDKLLESVNETIKITQETGVKTMISHFRPLMGYEKHYEAALGIIEKQSKLDLHFDNYPFDTSVVPIYTLLPKWMQIGGIAAMLSNLERIKNDERLITDLLKLKNMEIIVARAPSAKYLVGKSLADFARNQDLDQPQALIKLMRVTGLRAVVFHKNINHDLVVKSLTSEKGLIASNGAGLPNRPDVLKHERFYNTFPKFLHIVMEDKIMPLETAIKKITNIPAQKFNLKNRGLVKEGYVADLTMFNEEGIANVFVGGQLSVKDGQFNGTLAGKVLKRA